MQRIQVVVASLLILLSPFCHSDPKPQEMRPVPLPMEPHHHLVFENDDVRIFRVSVPAHDATLLHQHDFPYLYVSLGPADVINAVERTPEDHLVMADGQVGYSPGHFAQIVRNESGAPFYSVTIELLKTQGDVHKLCDGIIGGPALPCGEWVGRLDRVSTLLETDEIWVRLFTHSRPVMHAQFAQGFQRLLVVLEGTNLRMGEAGTPLHDVRPGDTLLLLPQVNYNLDTVDESPEGIRLLEIDFKKSGRGPT